MWFSEKKADQHARQNVKKLDLRNLRVFLLISSQWISIKLKKCWLATRGKTRVVTGKTNGQSSAKEYAIRHSCILGKHGTFQRFAHMHKQPPSDWDLHCQYVAPRKHEIKYNTNGQRQRVQPSSTFQIATASEGSQNSKFTLAWWNRYWVDPPLTPACLSLMYN